ncbi:MAG TPA: TonB family protein [Pyrinomonadaceae bacterium]|nr:TonB family protein [Pyrinomonadaceae bacterium]
MRRLVFIAGLLGLLVSVSHAQTPSLGVLDLGATPFAQKTTHKLRERLRSIDEFSVADPDLTRAAARGIGYSGSLNLSVSEARDLGAALATDFYVIGDVQTLRRSSFARPVYYESYCSVFLVNARSGELLFWDRPSLQSDSASETEDRMWSEIVNAGVAERIALAIRRAQLRDRRERIEQAAIANAAPLIQEAPDDDKAAEAQGFRLPRPYLRLRPEYPDTAARAEAEGTVDVLVDVGADGEVGTVRVARWAGFGLDEITVATVRKMHFFPAMKNGSPIAMRVLLRYNFRKPPR